MCAQRALGRIDDVEGRPEAAVGYLSEALGTFTGCRAAVEAARTRVDLAGVEAARANPGAARAHLVTAIATFEAAGAPRRAARARDVARSLRIGLDGA